MGTIDKVVEIWGGVRDGYVAVRVARQVYFFCRETTSGSCSWRLFASLPDSLPTMEIAAVPCLKDNYAWLLRDKASGKVAVVDPAESDKVKNALDERFVGVVGWWASSPSV